MFGQTIKKTSEEKPLNYWEKKKLAKEEEAKKKFNVMMSRRSSEQSSGSGYESGTGSFAGGAVKSRSRVGLSGPGEMEDKNPFNSLKKPAGFIKGSSSGSGFAKNLNGVKKDSLSSSAGAPRKPLGF